MIYLLMLLAQASLEYVAILNTESLLDSGEKDLIAEHLRSLVHIKITSENDRLRLITKENMLTIMQDQELDLNCLDTETCSVGIGRSIGADYVIGSSLSYSELYYVNLDLYSSETGELLYSKMLKDYRLEGLYQKMSSEMIRIKEAMGFSILPSTASADKMPTVILPELEEFSIDIVKEANNMNKKDQELERKKQLERIRIEVNVGAKMAEAQSEALSVWSTPEFVELRSIRNKYSEKVVSEFIKSYYSLTILQISDYADLNIRKVSISDASKDAVLWLSEGDDVCHQNPSTGKWEFYRYGVHCNPKYELSLWIPEDKKTLYLGYELTNINKKITPNSHFPKKNILKPTIDFLADFDWWIIGGVVTIVGVVSTAIATAGMVQHYGVEDGTHVHFKFQSKGT